MKYLFKYWEDVQKQLEQGHGSSYFFDLDGTLAPLASRPSKVRISSNLRRILNELSDKRGALVGVISGRPLAQVKKLARIKKAVLAGNHGYEIEGPRLRYRHPVDHSVPAELKLLAGLFRKALEPIPGVLIEEKGLSLGVHYRLVNRRDKKRFFSTVRRVVKAAQIDRVLKRRAGKKVVEFLPARSWNKGLALGYILNKKKRTGPAFFVGDDKTDEDAFRFLKGAGVGVRVGRNPRSHASYYLKDQAEVPCLMQLLIDL